MKTVECRLCLDKSIRDRSRAAGMGEAAIEVLQSEAYPNSLEISFASLPNGRLEAKPLE